MFIYGLIFGLILGVLLGYFFGREKSKSSSNIDKAQKAIQQKKEESKQKILQLFAEKEQITNDDVEQLLKISDRSAQRYLSELEEEGKLVRHGDTGRGVFFTKKGDK